MTRQTFLTELVNEGKELVYHIYQTFELKLPLVQVPLVAAGGVLGAIGSFLFFDPVAIVAMICLFLLDWGMAVFAHWRLGTLLSRKISVVLVRITVALLLMGFAHQFATFNPLVNRLLGVAGTSLSGIFYFIITSQLLISVLENAALLGVLPKDAVKAVKARLDWRKLVKKKSDGDQDGQKPAP